MRNEHLAILAPQPRFLNINLSSSCNHSFSASGGTEGALMSMEKDPVESKVASSGPKRRNFLRSLGVARFDEAYVSYDELGDTEYLGKPASPA